MNSENLIFHLIINFTKDQGKVTFINLKVVEKLYDTYLIRPILNKKSRMIKGSSFENKISSELPWMCIQNTF